MKRTSMPPTDNMSKISKKRTLFLLEQALLRKKQNLTILTLGQEADARASLLFLMSRRSPDKRILL